MDLDAFNQNKIKDRAQLVREQGTFLANRCMDNHLIELYHMGCFFAEVWYEPKPNKNGLLKSFLQRPALVSVQGFTYQDSLESYLEGIHLSDF